MTLSTAPPTLIERGVADPARILVPYVPGMLHEETVRRIQVSGREATFVDLDPADPYAYARLVDRWWNRGTDLIIVEHDVVPPFGFAVQFNDCPLSFCAFRYGAAGDTGTYGLGCARFRAQLQARVPSLAAMAGGAAAGRVFTTHWLRLNESMIQMCRRAGAPAHMHAPDAAHLHTQRGEMADAADHHR